ncbi:transmembrane protein [Cupriavidus basilensis OR16]|uniref:Transmembrane protein n=1 Tax=Cupriavidus basilensis OR16 TaxID=1127483 RepID=H1S032_9BURK|nr:hypothetical protein [Cupriavidus basilensis]EHP44248.1 transmembrane protein [Cupriavidus basilensis OR16]
MKALGLRCYLRMVRVGWAIPAASGLLVCATALVLIALPAERSALVGTQRQLAGVNAALAVPHQPSQTRRAATAQGLAAFYGALGQYATVEDEIGILFRIAGESGLSLRQAEYRASFDRSGAFYTYQIVLPVRGPYRSVRQFCEEVLNAIPFASLDEVKFKRGAIGEPTIEAKLQFTLFLTDRQVTSGAVLAETKPSARESP